MPGRRATRLVGFTDRWPDAFIADRCELGRRMSTDVPLGEQVLDEEVWDEARVRQIEATLAAQDRAKLSVAARHEASGHLVAYSELAVPRVPPSRCGSTTRWSCESTAGTASDWP